MNFVYQNTAESGSVFRAGLNSHLRLSGCQYISWSTCRCYPERITSSGTALEDALSHLREVSPDLGADVSISWTHGCACSLVAPQLRVLCNQASSSLSSILMTSWWVPGASQTSPLFDARGSADPLRALCEQSLGHRQFLFWVLRSLAVNLLVIRRAIMSARGCSLGGPEPP